MFKDLKKYKTHYLILFSGLALGVISFLLFYQYTSLKIVIVILVGAFYFLWGVIHHKIKKDLHAKIKLEYFLIAAISVVILVSLILRG